MPHPDNFDASRNMRYVCGRVLVNGAGTFGASSGATSFFTAARTGVGTATIKILIPCTDLCDFQVTYSKAAILNRLIHILGWTQGTDGMFTVQLALSDLNNAGVVAAEWAAAAATAFISFSARLQMGTSST